MVDVVLLNQLNLVFQIAIVALFGVGIGVKLTGRSLLHGKLMLVAFLLNAGSLFFIMLPLLLTGIPIFQVYFDAYAAIVIAHHAIGLLAFVLSLFLVSRFVRARFTLKLCRGKWLMRLTATLWATALVLGLYLYLSGYFI